MKLAALIFAIAATSLNAQTVTYTNLVAAASNSVSLNIPAGQLARVVYLHTPLTMMPGIPGIPIDPINGFPAVAPIQVHLGYPTTLLSVTIGGITVTNDVTVGSNWILLPSISGPAILSLVASESPVAATIQLSTFGAAQTFIPANSVVVPSDASGPVQIILESSVDMISWNAALPGSYAASTPSRFFRVRAQK